MAPISTPKDAGKCVFSSTERDEFADLLAKRFIDLFFARLSAAADQEESEKMQDLGRRIDGLWRKWRFRILLPLGCVGVALAAGIRFSKKEVIDFLVKLLMGA